jgi:serine/threonine protein kinase
MSQSPKGARGPSVPPAVSDADTPAERRTVPGADSPLEAPTAPHAPDAANAVSLGPPSMIGRTFGDYELLSELGRGGMGVVYKARQKSLDRTVALKVLGGDHLQNPVLLARFLTEARTVASLSHPNIVNVFQIGQEGPWHYFVMEFIDGETLEGIAKKRPIPIAWAVNVMVPVAEAVHYAHGAGVIHRDLKPGNIMTDRFGRPMVMDFGIAKSVSKPSSLTQEGTIVGTPAFMSPEQAGDDMSIVGPLSDVYSLGAVLYKLLAGKAPFDEGSFLKTVLKVISPDPPTPIRQLRADVPALLEQICMKCLSKRPADRYASARALAEDLRHCRATYFTKGSSSVSVRPPQTAVYLVSEETQKEIRLKEGTTVVGRAKECKLVLKVSAVSKRHCQLEVQGERVTVEDLGSVNGTSVNGKRIQRSALVDGDSLDIAGHVFKVRVQKV